MKFTILFLTLLLSMSSFAGFENKNEGEIHSPNYCSSVLTKSCAHLKFEDYPTTTKEGEFIVHVLPEHSSTIIKEIKVSLWMDMGNGNGHGSAPVEVLETEELNHFFVQNAWFVMKGNWLVRISYLENKIEQKIEIPLTIKE